jgi:hypothetical protein
MAGTQRLLAIAMSFSLAGIPARGKPDALGIIAEADHANLGSQAAAEGTTIFDGDRLSTDAGGSLRLVLGGAMLYLGEQSSVIVHNDASRAAKHFVAELVSGAVVLSAADATLGEIVASSARVRSVAETRGVVQVRRVGPQELIVYARRGATEICYRGECETIPEGKSYRVMLNPSDDAPPGAAGTKSSGQSGRVFVLIAVGVTTGAGIAALWGGGQSGQKSVESPDKP